MKTGLIALGILLAACGDDGAPPMMGVDSGPMPDAPAVRDCVSDDECDDALFCNGLEQCITGFCRPGVMPDCDDTLPCTVDRCSEEMTMCVHLPPDFDGDGHLQEECGGDDCDDEDPNRFPGNDEACDAEGHDEDCDPRSVGDRDEDGDGYIDTLCCNTPEAGSAMCGTDCNDLDPGSHPTESEVCDGTDNDCDGTIDDGVDLAGYADMDHDLHGDPDAAMRGCPGRGSFSAIADDCDDMNPARHGAQPEFCDGIDNDCDGMVDDGTRAVTWYRDLDGDGFGRPESGTTVSCEVVPGHSLLGNDCDDDAVGVHPSAGEQCNGLDDDCNGEADFILGAGNLEDDDGDRHPDMGCPRVGDDCDDRNPSTFTGAMEQCDGRDNDCDGTTDGAGAMAMWYPDRDNDGYGDPDEMPIVSCTPQVGRVPFGNDCDDSSAAFRPGAADGCDGRDQDCDGELDESSFRIAFYRDADGDGAGGAAPVFACMMPAGHGATPADCDDADPMVAPGRPEDCDSGDDDCDGVIDEGAILTFYPDADGDGFGDSSLSDTRMGCSPPTGFGAAGDCDDMSAARRPGGVERCDLVDNDCDLMTDEGADATCSLPGVATSTCMGGVCRATTCAMGRGDCDTMASNGCEIDLTRTASHCGTCATACSIGDACSSGVCLSSDIADLFAAEAGTYARRESGGGAVWGENVNGTLGAGDAAPHLVPAPALLEDAVDVALGKRHGCAVRRDGRVTCWGNNVDGQLGDGTFVDRPGGVVVLGITDAIGVAVGEIFDTGYMHSCALRSTGAVMCWGNNQYGQLGGGTASSTDVPIPQPMMGVTDAVAVSTGERFTCVLLSDGSVRCAGHNGVGELGDGTLLERTTAVPVIGLVDAVALAETSGTNTHMCAVRETGQAVCWGGGTVGQLGDGGLLSRNSPVSMSGMTSVVEISIGGANTCVRRSVGAGEMYCTGINDYSQLGSAGGIASVPIRVALTGNVQDITLGRFHACALLEDMGEQQVWCWGDNRFGQLGQGASGGAGGPTAVRVMGL